jgi:hypothetical protein
LDALRSVLSERIGIKLDASVGRKSADINRRACWQVAAEA